MRRARPAAPRGFTLVEVLVALVAMALLAALAWQGLGGVLRAREVSGQALDRTLRLNTAVVQWEQDLQSLIDTGTVPPLQFNGQTLVLTRRGPDGVALVAWSVRSGLWQRWAGPSAIRVADLREGWVRAQGLLGNEPGHVTVAEGVSGWQLYKYLGGRKANMQSSGDVAQAPAGAASGAAVAREALPEAIEMAVTLDGRTLTRVIGLGPAGAGT